MSENTARGVSSNTFAINVEQSTQQFSAPYQSLNSDLGKLNQKKTLPKYQALHRLPVTPARVERLERLLHCYEENKKIFFVDGLRCGFRVNFVGDQLPFQSPNLKSVLDQLEIARMKLHKECDAGHIVVFLELSLLQLFLPLLWALCRRKTHLNFVRFIIYPIQKFILLMMVFLTIVPLLNMCPLAMRSQCLPTGLSSSCNIIVVFSTALDWSSIHHLGASSVLHILDDFLLLQRPKTRARPTWVTLFCYVVI